MKTLLLIDSHAIIYRMFHGMAPLTGPTNEPVGALYGLAKLLLTLWETEHPEYIAACFDRPEPTFRKEKFAEYKATRQLPPADLIDQLQHAREVFEAFKIKVFEKAGFEADDLIGTIAEKYKTEPDLKIVISSGDRDLLQLVDDDKVVVDLVKTGADPVQFNADKVREVYELEPNQIIELKGLMGDASDNIPGVDGVGPKTATPLLKEFKTIEEVYENLVIVPKKTAAKFEGKKEIALLSRDLATIKRDVPMELNSLEDVRAHPLDKKNLTEWFKKYGFVSLIERLDKIAD